MRGDILKKKLMVLCAVAIMISTCLTGCKMNSGKIRFGSAGIGGTYQIFGDTFANLISSKSKKYNIEVKQLQVLLQIFVCYLKITFRWLLPKWI